MASGGGAPPVASFSLAPQPQQQTTASGSSTGAPASTFSFTLKPQLINSTGATSTAGSSFTLQAQPLSSTGHSFTLTPQPLAAAPAAAAAPTSFTIKPSSVAGAAPAAATAAAAAAPAAATPASSPASSGRAYPSGFASEDWTDGTFSLAANPNPRRCPPLRTDLLIVDDANALEQCQDWVFFVELIDDVLGGKEASLDKLSAFIDANDWHGLQDEAHSLKGAALNLHLMALADITKKLELVGKQLMLTPTHPSYRDACQPFLKHLRHEYERLEAVLPEYRAKAEAEGEGGADGAVGYEDDEGGEPNWH